MLHRELPIVAHDTSARTVTVQLCAWSSPREVVDRDGTRYREQYEPGSIEIADVAHVVDRHDGTLIGRADPASLADTGTGPTVDLIVARSDAGNNTMALVDAGVIRAVSIEIEDTPDGTHINPRERLVTRTRAIVHGIAFAFRPQLDAPILAVRSTDDPDPDDPDETDPDPDADPDADPEQETQPVTTIDTPTLPARAGDTTVAVVSHDLLTRSIDGLRDEIRRDNLAAATAAPAGHPLARFRSLDEFTTAAYTDPTLRGLLHRSLVDQITTNNPGVVPPGWVQTVYGIVDRGRPTITAFGTASLPPEGMDINWPFFDGDLLALVGEQLAQKTAITSVRVDLKKGTEALRTFAGGSDISYQLIRRSSPSYRDAYMRIMFAAYAAVTNAAAAADASAAAGTHITYDIATDTTGDALRAALVAASIAVETATGTPAEFALAATDVFGKIGGMTGLYPAPYGTANVAGTADAASLNISVSGLPILHEPALPAGRLLVSNSAAGDWYEDGPLTVAAEDVEKLGQNVAVWGMGAFAAALPAGIAYLSALVTATARGRKAADD